MKKTFTFNLDFLFHFCYSPVYPRLSGLIRGVEQPGSSLGS